MSESGPLEPAPQGELLEVVDYDPVRAQWHVLVDLDDTFILAEDGLRPAEGDLRSHQQIVYAVAASVIERYLGRPFPRPGVKKLSLVPHAFEGRAAVEIASRDSNVRSAPRTNASQPCRCE
jgi:hypothetical protein